MEFPPEVEFPPNSNVSKTPSEKDGEEKRAVRVVTGEVKRRKKTLGSRFKEVFVGEDVGSVWDYILFDVVVPAAKDMVTDAITQGFERLVFGESRSSRRRGSYRPTGNYVSYNRYSSSAVRGREEPRERDRRSSRQRHAFDDIILPSRQDAEQVLDQLFEILSKYEQVTVSDLLETVGLTPTFTDERWGWVNLRGANTRRVSSGYLLDLPRAEPL